MRPFVSSVLSLNLLLLAASPAADPPLPPTLIVHVGQACESPEYRNALGTTSGLDAVVLREGTTALSAPRIGMLVAGQGPHLWIRNAWHYTQGATWRCTDARTYEPCGSFIERHNERAVRAAVAGSGKLLLLTEDIEGRLRYAEFSPR